MRYLGYLPSIRHKQIRCALPLTERQIVVSSYGEDRVVLYEVHNESDYVPKWSAPLPHPRGICADERRCYVASYGDPLGSISAVDRFTGHGIWTNACPRPRGVALDNDQLCCTQVSTGHVAIHSTSTGAQTDSFAVELVTPRGIALVESGVYVVAESDRNCVTKVSRNAVLRRQNDLSHCNDVACHGASVAVSLWYDRVVVLLNASDLSVLCKTSVLGPSYGLAMISMTPTEVLVGDDCLDCVHVLRHVNAITH